MLKKQIDKGQMIMKTVILGIITLVSYYLIFSHMAVLNDYLLSKQAVPATALLCIVVFIAFSWGTAASNLLSFFGIEGKH